MLIRIASDLHLEFFENPVAMLAEHLVPADGRDASAVLVLAGDVSARPDQLRDFLHLMEQRFCAVIYVPGNHEYYGHELQAWDRAAWSWRAEFKRTHIAAGETRTTTIDGLVFIASTLWGNGGAPGPEREELARGLGDFHLIRYADQRFTPANMADQHRQHRSNIARALREMPGPKVVVTHHLPSFSLCHPRFGAHLNGGFASGCDHLMLGEHAPALWVHGHTHDTIDTVIGRTRVVCNPAGYRPEWGSRFNTYFAEPKFVELDANGGPCAP